MYYRSLNGFEKKFTCIGGAFFYIKIGSTYRYLHILSVLHLPRYVCAWPPEKIDLLFLTGDAKILNQNAENRSWPLHSKVASLEKRPGSL